MCRVTEVSRWQDIMNNCLQAIEQEIADMASEKAITEAETEALNLNFTLVNECLTMRDQRGGSDLCRDEAEVELKHVCCRLWKFCSYNMIKFISKKTCHPSLEHF